MPEQSPAVPSPPGQPGPLTSGPTGDPGVDALVELAARASGLPVGEQQERYAQVLAGLERELDADPGAAITAAAQDQGSAQ